MAPEDTLVNGWTPEAVYQACSARHDELFDPGMLVSRAPFQDSEIHEIDAGIWTVSIPVERVEAGPGTQSCTVSGSPAEPIVEALDNAY
ncbi:hypothetical protein GCM10009851_26440 [Herbiconiux moechotypicola]|uniref:Uncharacterized protein n=1 Tax=Herbiconiux moechotypicola TaxID=637393 RepID=A0ABP5QLT5_9MICO